MCPRRRLCPKEPPSKCCAAIRAKTIQSPSLSKLQIRNLCQSVKFVSQSEAPPKSHAKRLQFFCLKIFRQRRSRPSEMISVNYPFISGYKIRNATLRLRKFLVPLPITGYRPLVTLVAALSRRVLCVLLWQFRSFEIASRISLRLS